MVYQYSVFLCLVFLSVLTPFVFMNSGVVVIPMILCIFMMLFH